MTASERGRAPSVATLPRFPAPSPADEYVASGRTVLAALTAAAANGRRVLDVGCKGGYLLRHLARTTEPEVLVGLDRGAHDLPAPGQQFHLVAGDALSLPMSDGQFDLVTFFDVLEHLPPGTEPQALREIARVLCPQGLLLLTTPADWRVATLLDPLRYTEGHRHYARDDLLALATAAGFRPELAETRGGWADVVGLPLFYLTARLGLPMPGSRWFAQLTNVQYDRNGRYTHFLALRKR